MATDRTSITITDDRRRLEDRCREELGDTLPDTQFRATLYDIALKNLLDTIHNHDEHREQPPAERERWRTRVVRPHYSTSVETRRP